MEWLLDEALEETFPASDPIAVSVAAWVTARPDVGNQHGRPE
jgi:hypothetical protein